MEGEQKHILASSVHPRVCGEHRNWAIIKGKNDGSSPRVRGTYDVQPKQLSKVRFIPACAGNITHTNLGRHAQSVHPRVCGEHSKTPSANPHSRGSSPRVRGTYCGLHPVSTSIRFIPACAGNISAAGGVCRSEAVHPRVCGEHPVNLISLSLEVGSSPRVRGTSA